MTFVQVRNLLVATTAAATLASAAYAQQSADTWRDPQGRLEVTFPHGWTVRERESKTAGAVRVFGGSGDFECQVWSLPTPETAHDTPENSKQRYARARTAEQWQNMVAPLNYFPSGQIQVSDQTVDTSGAWSVEHVTLTGGAQTVRGTFQGRPGLELLSLCASFDDQDRNATFAQIERSIDGAALPAS
ncbi:MAG TPA: hypothetical protein VHC73_02145 [Vitreimonas sp.]|jgi:hypothetical protein|nr:hypothetical protein [Vitreimonas sp.]